MIMRNPARVWVAIVLLSGMFLLGQDTWPPPPQCVTDADCDDGVACNGTETCAESLCRPGTGDCVFRDIEFTRDIVFGTQDPAGRIRSGNECNAIVVHRGMLFASTSTYHWDTTVPYQGPQILVKAAGAAEWVVDHGFGDQCGRAEYLHSVRFTTDSQGNPLDPPEDILLASATCTTLETAIWSRDDLTGEWTRMAIAPVDAAFETENRSMLDHLDKVTGVHSVFVGSTSGRIYRGAYDAGEPGRIRWETSPEYDAQTPDRLRIPNMAVVNGDLYAAIAEDALGNGGLYRRLDGSPGQWELVYRWPYDGGVEGYTEMRGLSAIPAAPGSTRQHILATDNGFEDSPAVVRRIDPDAGYTENLDLDVTALFAAELPAAKLLQLAVNPLTRVDLPSGASALFMGLWLYFPTALDTEDGNASWFLVRQDDGAYQYGRVYDPVFPVPNPGKGGLRLTRPVCVSPFPEDGGNVLYFGGFDTGLGSWPMVFADVGWIYKATLR